MNEKRFECDALSEYRDYGIFDLSKADKTKEDFWDNEEECYKTYAFHNYLVDSTDSMLNGEEVENLMNKQNEEIQRLEKLSIWARIEFIFNVSIFIFAIFPFMGIITIILKKTLN